jgi:hypothetical protein
MQRNHQFSKAANPRSGTINNIRFLGLKAAASASSFGCRLGFFFACTQKTRLKTAAFRPWDEITIF